MSHDISEGFFRGAKGATKKNLNTVLEIFGKSADKDAIEVIFGVVFLDIS